MACGQKLCICFHNFSFSQVLCRFIPFKLTVKNTVEPGTKSYDCKVENGGSLLQALEYLQRDSSEFRYGIRLCNPLCFGYDSKSEDFRCVTTPLLCVYFFVMEKLVVNYLQSILPMCTLESLTQPFCSFVTLCSICSFKTERAPRIAPYLVEVNDFAKGPNKFWDAFLFNEETKDVIPICEYKTGEMVRLPKIITSVVIFLCFSFVEELNSLRILFKHLAEFAEINSFALSLHIFRQVKLKHKCPSVPFHEDFFLLDLLSCLHH